jgi:hypothetical protein
MWAFSPLIAGAQLLLAAAVVEDAGAGGLLGRRLLIRSIVHRDLVTRLLLKHRH